MLKAELEMMKGATEASSLDLEQVRNLLDLCTGKDVITNSPRIIKSRQLEPSLAIICDFTCIGEGAQKVFRSIFFCVNYFTAAKRKLDKQKQCIYCLKSKYIFWFYLTCM